MSTKPSRNAAPFTMGEVARITGGALVGEDAKVQGVCTDSRALWEGALFLALRGETFDGHRFAAAAAAGGAAGALVEAGAPLPEGIPQGFPVVEVSDTLAALGALGQAHRARFSDLRVGAITGSNGKTTTKELAASIFEEAFGPTLKTEGNLNNEIGLPLTLLRLEPGQRAACLELGMNHSGEIERLTRIAGPSAGVVTSVQAVHLEGLGSLEGVARAKGELFHTLPADGIAVANADDPLALAQAKRAGRRLLTFGSAGADVALQRLIAHDLEGLSFEVRILGGASRTVRLPLVGLHNVTNALAALALGIALGATEEAALAGLAKARGFARRLELRKAPGGVTVLDDCYNGNPASAVAALRTARALVGEGRVHAVLGDLKELGAYEREGHVEVGRAAAEAGVASLVAFGPLSRSTAEGAHGAGLERGRAIETDDPVAALAWLRPRLEAGDLVLIKASRGTRLERIADPLVEGA